MSGLVEVRDLHVHYGESHVLRGVSVSINAGESIGLLGRNGMGKTTLIRALVGFNRASAGRVLLHGRDCTLESPHRIARLGVAYVPEGRGIFPNLTVRENLCFAARDPVREDEGWTYERVLATFPRLRERLASRGHHLSGGEQQMLAIGRALMTNPKLLILDEATEGLAPLIREEIWHCLSMLKKRGQSILVVDKNVDHLARICDRHTIIERGRTVWSGTSDELMAEPDLQHKYLGI